MFHLEAGDSLEIQLEGNMIVIKPIAELSTDNSVQDNMLLFLLAEKTAQPTIKFPLRKLSGQINKVG